MPNLRALVILLLCPCAAFAAVESPKSPVRTVAELRKGFMIPAGARLEFQSEDGSKLSEQEFVERFTPGSSVQLIKNPAKGTYTLALAKASEIRKAAPIVDVPRFSLTQLDGRRIAKEQFARKPTFISFFFAECVPCIQEVPAFNAFRRKHPEFDYLAVTFDDRKTAQGFVDKYRLEWPVAHDALEFIEQTGVNGYPTYLLMSMGEVVDSANGFDTTKGEAAAVAQLEEWTANNLKRRPWQVLLDPKLSNFDTYLSWHGSVIMDVVRGNTPKDAKSPGLNHPKQNVFTVAERGGKPVLRISGEFYGCLVTKHGYENYHFTTQVKWGDKKWEPRLSELKDSGILYHSRGPFGVDYWKSWALSQEFQVIEHGHGEYWSQSTSAFDIRANPRKAGEVAPRWDPKAPWMAFGGSNNHALAGSDEDRPNQWNSLELVCIQGDCVHIVNGKVVMALKNSRYKDGDRFVPLTSGKLQIQSEAAEVYYRDMAIRPIAAMPAEYANYFQ